MGKVSGEVHSKKGFYIGDICYALRDDIYDDFWGKVGGYQDGKFIFEGDEFIVASTKYGDGYYTDDEDQYDFPVDAGVLGVVPLELVDETKLPALLLSASVIYEGSGMVTMRADDGKFVFVLPDGEVIKVNTDVE